MVEQVKSQDYDRLYDLVVNQGFRVPCCLDYTFSGTGNKQTDFASVRFDGEAIIVGVRGRSYFSCSPLDVNEYFKTIKEMFVHDCKRENLAWFDTFSPLSSKDTE